MSSIQRRHFLQTAAAVGFTAASAKRILGANDRVNIAVVGLGGRGQAHMKTLATIGGTRIAGLCDVDQASLERGTALVEKAGGEKPKGFSDMRKLFEDKGIDAVSMPLPNHWHALATIWACQAGKDVYVEKPACHNIFEGRKMVEAARKYQRMVQIGSQGRSTPHKIRAMQLLKDGEIGKLYMAKGVCFKRRPSIGHKPDGSTPPGVNWDLFLGPAPMRAFNENRFKYNWHWFWDTGNGDIGNQGVHEMDIARWGLGVGMPVRVTSTGGKYAYDDDQETPNTQYASLDYGNGVELTFEVRGLLTDGEGALPFDGKNCVGDLFYGADGFMAVDGSSFQVYKGEKREKTMDERAPKEDNTTKLHLENFLKAVRSRNYKDLNADIETAAISADLCHLANISYRLKRGLAWDAAKGTVGNDDEANRMISRPYRSPYIVPDKV